jgi:PAS domain S-box-containing protein
MTGEMARLPRLAIPVTGVLAATAVGLGLLALVLLLISTWLAPVAGTAAVVCLVARRALERDAGLGADELSRLANAEVALASAASTQAAARNLAKHAVALLDAPAALVLIEGIGDTVREAAGSAPAETVYEPGSRMRLLDDDGLPMGSIAVAARSDGRPYGERDERILDALAQRVSSTLHRLSLFDAVRAEQRTLADVVESSSDGIFSVGPDLRVRSWNPAMARTTGVEPASALGEPCCSVFRPVDEAGLPRYGSECPGRTGKAVDAVVRLTPPGGNERWLNVAYSPLRDGGYVAVVRDVTARKQVDDEKADFLATVSHELRTPLTPLKGFLQTLLRRGDGLSPDERQRIYEVMLREEERLERLVEQLLHATSLDHAARLAVIEPVEWRPLVDDVVESFRRHDPSRPIVVDAPARVPAVRADRQLAERVLANLISNAMKYSPPGEPVRLQVRRNGEAVVTVVVDRGPGVAPDDRERIFEKFTRLGDHLTRPQQGVGLGLYIARRSAETLGGRVWVDDGPEGGSAFSFTLPIDDGDSTPRAELGNAELRHTHV